MGKMSDLKRLIPLARLKSDFATIRLARAVQTERDLQTRIARLDETRTEPYADVHEIQAALRARAWRATRREALNAELAQARARNQPLREAASKMEARVAIMTELHRQHRNR